MMFPEVKAFVNDLRAHYRAVGLPDANKSRLMQLRSKACTARQSAIRPAPTFPPPSAVLPVLQNIATAGATGGLGDAVQAVVQDAIED